MRAKYTVTALSCLVLLATLPPAQAQAQGAHQLASVQLYRLKGGDWPIFGHKLAGGGFITCDGGDMPEQDASKLENANGECGDHSVNVSGLTMFLVGHRSADGSATVSVIDSNTDIGRTIVGKDSTLSGDLLRKILADKPHDASSIWVTSNTHDLVQSGDWH